MEGWVDLGTAVKMHSPCPRLCIAAALNLGHCESSSGVIIIVDWFLTGRRERGCRVRGPWRRVSGACAGSRRGRRTRPAGGGSYGPRAAWRDVRWPRRETRSRCPRTPPAQHHHNHSWVLRDRSKTSVTAGLAETNGSLQQRRRNDGGARPRNVETTGARVSFRPRNIFPHFLHAVP